MIPPTILLFLVLVCPESPRFYIRRGKYVEAYKSLRHLRGTDIQAARDLYSIHSQLQAETNLFVQKDRRAWYEALIFQDWIKHTKFYERMWYLFSKPRSRRACVVAFILMAAQQLCGVSTSPLNIGSHLSESFYLIDAADQCTCILFLPSFPKRLEDQLVQLRYVIKTLKDL